MAVGLLRRSISRGSINRRSQARALRHASLRTHPMPSRTIEESHRPRVSDRTMHCHSRSGQSSGLLFQKRWCRHNSQMEPPEGRTASPLRTQRQRPYRLRKTTLSLGWAECRKKIGIEPTRRCFLLTFLFIGLRRLLRLPGLEVVSPWVELENEAVEIDSSSYLETRYEQRCDRV